MLKEKAEAWDAVEPLAIRTPSEDERPPVYADCVGESHAARKSARRRKEHGLFLTPVSVADSMAGRMMASKRKLPILDPAAGAGVLCCAAVEAFVFRKPDAVELVAHEDHKNLIAPLQAVLGLPRRLAPRSRRSTRCPRRSRQFHPGICRSASFAWRDIPHPDGGGRLRYRHLLSTVLQDRQERHACRRRLRGGPWPAQPLRPLHGGGRRAAARRRRFRLVAPHSFASGPYFRRYQGVFFDTNRPTEITVFGLWLDASVRDEALQENVILAGIRRNLGPVGDDVPLAISSSRGVGDIDESARRKIPEDMVLDLESLDRAFRLSARGTDDKALALVGSSPDGLRDLNVSTGPVVPFRAADWIGREGEALSSHAPLLWMNHAHGLRTTWPISQRKPEYFRRAGPFLLSNKNYVLLRRFSAKEEPRRVTAVPWFASEFAMSEIGIENHLNYIHRLGVTLSENESCSLAALYNSRRLDTWFRAVNGNTEVSAMPLPAHGTILALGQRVKRLADSMEGLDAFVMDLVGRLKEAAAEREQQLIVRKMQILVEMTEFEVNFGLPIPVSCRDYFVGISDEEKQDLEST